MQAYSVYNIDIGNSSLRKRQKLYNPQKPKYNVDALLQEDVRLNPTQCLDR